MILLRRFLWILFVLFVIEGNSQNLRLKVPIGHSDLVRHAEFIQNDQRLLTVSDDKTMKLWDVVSGKMLVSIDGELGQMRSPQISKDGTRLLIIYNELLQLWNLKSGVLIRQFEEDMSFGYYGFNNDGALFYLTTSKECVYSSLDGSIFLELEKKDSWANSGIELAQFSPDGSNFALISSQKDAIYIHELSSGKELAQLSGSVKQFVYSPDGNYIASFNLENETKIWDLQKNELKSTFPKEKEYLKEIVFSPDSKRLLTIPILSFSATLWNTEDGKRIGQVYGENGSAEFQFSINRPELIATGYGGSLLWNTITGEKINLPSTKSSFIDFIHKRDGYWVTESSYSYFKKVDYDGKSKFLSTGNKLYLLNSSADGKLIVGTEKDPNMVSIWDLNSGVRLSEMKGFTQFIKEASLLSGGKNLITRTADKMNVWYLDQYILNPVENNLPDSIELIRHSPDGETMVILFNTDQQRVGLYRAEDYSAIDPNLKKTGIQNITSNNEGSFKFTGDGQKLFISNNDWGSYLFDTKTGKMIKSIRHSRCFFSTIDLNAHYFVSSINNTFELFNLLTDEQRSYSTLSDIQKIEFVDDQSKLLVAAYQDLFLFDVNKSKPIMRMKNGKYVLSKDGRFLFLENEFSRLTCYDLRLQKELYDLTTDTENYEYMNDISLSGDGTNLIISTNQRNFLVINSTTGELVRSIDGKGRNLSLSGDGKFLYGIDGASVEVFDAVNFKKLITVNDDNSQIIFANILGEKLMTISNGNMVRFWGVGSGEMISSQPILNKDMSFISIPSGYFKANSEGSKQLYYLDDQLTIYAMDQLDLKFNRPDLVLKALGSEDTMLINSYFQAYVKRLNKMRVNTAAFSEDFSFPELEIVNKDMINYDQQIEKINFHVSASDSGGILERFNIWINEVPVFGEQGNVIENVTRDRLDTILTVQLSQGLNKIEASVTNSNAIESFRSPIYINYTPTEPYSPKTHFIGIGIDKFYQPGHDLSYSVKDLRDLSKALKEKLGDELTVDTLFNQNVSLSNVQALKKKLLNTNINDKVIISYSGHGLLNEHYDYFLSSYNVDFSHPEKGGIPYEVLEDLLDSIPSRKKLLLIDACHSGEVDKDDFRRMKEVAGAKGIVQPKGGDTESTAENPTIGLQNSFELMQELFVNVKKGSGATIISAAAGDQFALEGGNIENGFFTYAILRYMRENKEVSINSLKKYVYKEVEELSGGMQKPTSRIENLEMDWKIAE